MSEIIDRAKEVRKRLRESSRIAKMGEIAGESGAGDLSKQFMEAADMIKLLCDELEGKFFQGELPDGAVIEGCQFSGDLSEVFRALNADKTYFKTEDRYAVYMDWPTDEELLNGRGAIVGTKP